MFGTQGKNDNVALSATEWLLDEWQKGPAHLQIRERQEPHAELQVDEEPWHDESLHDLGDNIS
eukprot:12932703-Prorocentrum_lima.AAC.1